MMLRARAANVARRRALRQAAAYTLLMTSPFMVSNATLMLAYEDLMFAGERRATPMPQLCLLNTTLMSLTHTVCCSSAGVVGGMLPRVVCRRYMSCIHVGRTIHYVAARCSYGGARQAALTCRS